MSISNVSSYPQLLKTLATEQKIVYLCGAGASMSLANHNISWSKWILAGKDYLENIDKSELDKRIGAWSSNELIDAATYLLDRLKFSGSYEAFMKSTIGSVHPVNNDFIEALRKIWRVGDLLATTNYDLSLEEAIDAKTATYSTPTEILSIIRGDLENRVIHLHGAYDSLHGLDDIVADDPQYKAILANSGAQFIQNLISTHPIIIVGCGGTVEDPNLSGFMSFVVDKLGANDVPYFYLMKNGDKAPELPVNAIPVYYGDEYSELPIFLSQMSMVRLRRRAGISSVAYINPYTTVPPVTTAFGRMYFYSGFSNFIGRVDELRRINEFIDTGAKFAWWAVVGEGGIGKSRLVLEALKRMPSNWFGFFGKKNFDEAMKFQPFTDTVIVFDYVLGTEHDCAETVGGFIESFIDSPYKLRILFIERAKDTEDWLKSLKRTFDTNIRLTFEGGEYSKEPLLVNRLSEADEIEYIANYLKCYLPLIDSNPFIGSIKSDIKGYCKIIHAAFAESVEETCQRPLYLSIFIEVWVSKEGKIAVSKSEELLDEYLNREKNRWKTVLSTETLVDAYYDLLTMACAIERFNITDVYGDNFLSEECKALNDYLDSKQNKAGASNLYEDLFIFRDVREEVKEGKELVFEAFFYPEEHTHIMGEENTKRILDLDQEERFAFSTPYIKLDADPEEVYLHMLKSVGLLDDNEIVELNQLHEKNIARANSLPDHAWIIEPVLPDIIKEYIVSSSLRDSNVVRFTKLARSNSILGISQFLIRALEDLPRNDVFQRMVITPPNEVLNYFEYYISLLVRIKEVCDIKTVEKALIDVDHAFFKYELELWRRIAYVLGDRGDIDILYESGCRFIEYLKGLENNVEVRNDVAEILRQYCLELHNSGQEEKFISFVNMIDGVEHILLKNSTFGLLLCENYRVIAAGKYVSNKCFNDEWKQIQRILSEYECSDDMIAMAMKVANSRMLSLKRNGDVDGLIALELYLEEIYEEHKLLSVSEEAALVTANVYMFNMRRRDNRLAREYDKIKGYLREYPDSKKIRSAYITITMEEYLNTSRYRKVPNEVISQAKNWFNEYPDDIEFPEAYFGILMAKLEYAQTHDMRNEQGRLFKEMKKVAENTDYAEYHEENSMIEAVRMLQTIYGY